MKLASNNFEKKQVVEGYLRRRASEDSVNLTVDEPAILSLLTQGAEGQMLEIGCATGQLTKKLANIYSTVVAVDASEAMISEASKEAPENVTFVQSYVEDLNLDAVFPTVVSSLTLHLVPDLGLALEIIRYHTELGGRFICSMRHPIRTSNPQGASVDQGGSWEVKNYFDASGRDVEWLGATFTHYHRPISLIYETLSNSGFLVTKILEPIPDKPIFDTDKIIENGQVPSIVLFDCIAK